MKTIEETVVRFNFSQRFLHWTHGLTWLGLFITGLFLLPYQAIFFLLFPHPRGFIGGHVITIKLWHDFIAIPFILIPILIYFLGIKRKNIKKNPGPTSGWLCITRGKFRPFQKSNIWITVIFGLGFTITGGIIWGGSSFFPLFILETASFSHRLLTYASLILIGAHLLYIILILGHDAMLGMVLGKVRVLWTKEKFPHWVAR